MMVVPWLTAGGGERQLVTLCQGLAPRVDIDVVVSHADRPQHFVGELAAWPVHGPATDIAPRVRALDALVLPSDAEGGIPYAVMEAMAAGVPTMVTPVSDLPVLFRDGEELLYLEKSPESIAEATQRLLDDGELRAKLAANARVVLDEHLTADAMVARYAELLGLD